MLLNLSINRIWPLLFVVFFFGCTKQDYYSLEQLNEVLYDESNGVYKLQDEGKFRTELVLKPYQIFVDLDYEKKATKENLAKLMQYYETQIYFLLTLRATTMNEKEIYANYGNLSFYLNGKIQAFHSQEIPLLDYQMNTTSLAYGDIQFLLSFDKKELLKEKKITIKIHPFLQGMKETQFDFRTKDLRWANSLKIETLYANN